MCVCIVYTQYVCVHVLCIHNTYVCMHGRSFMRLRPSYWLGSYVVVYLCVRVCMCMCVCVCMHVCMCMHACMHACAHKRMYVRVVFACIVHTHTHIHIPGQECAGADCGWRERRNDVPWCQRVVASGPAPFFLFTRFFLSVIPLFMGEKEKKMRNKRGKSDVPWCQRVAASGLAPFLIMRFFFCLCVILLFMGKRKKKREKKRGENDVPSCLKHELPATAWEGEREEREREERERESTWKRTYIHTSLPQRLAMKTSLTRERVLLVERMCSASRENVFSY